MFHVEHRSDGSGKTAPQPKRPARAATGNRIVDEPDGGHVRLCLELGKRFARRQREPPADQGPGLDPAQRLVGLGHRLTHRQLARLRFEQLRPPAQGFDIAKPELAYRSALKVMALLPRFNEQHRALGPEHSDRKPRETGPRAEIDEARHDWQAL